MKTLLAATLAALAPALATAQEDPATRGAYLVTIGGCNDCHTPLKMGANGPEPDMARMLSGHPQDIALEFTPVAPPWMVISDMTNTAWSGPWGVSFSANLTPDPTGVLAGVTEEQFFNIMRNGRHQGQGRPILPPMPWFNYGKATDADLGAIYAYLRTIPPVSNTVPDPLPPAQ